MKTELRWLLEAMGCLLPLVGSHPAEETSAATVPITLDHNRMLVDGEFQRQDGSWRKARIWVDTGNPDSLMSEALARDLGIDLSAAKEKTVDGKFEVPPPKGVRIGGMRLKLEAVKSQVCFEPRWLYAAVHIDANLPSTVLKQYEVVFDYPKLRLTVARPDARKPRGVRAWASVHPKTGIIQLDAIVNGDSYSFALDNGASYSFVSDEVLTRLSERHPTWPHHSGAVGCANMWGWMPNEPAWPMLRVPAMRWGPVRLADLGIVGLPKAFADWYSQKTARPVSGILGANALKAFRVEIDYAGSAVYFKKGAAFDSHDMDVVGLTLRPEADGSYQVIGVAKKNGKPAAEIVEPGDKLLTVDGLEMQGATMGAVVDALRGKPGAVHTLLLERMGRQFKIDAKVERFL